MPRVIITASVEDSARWEENYLKHGALLASMSQSVTHYTTTADNEVALYSEPEDLEKYMEVLESQDTVAAMALDGVKRETVRIYVLDKEFSY